MILLSTSTEITSPFFSVVIYILMSIMMLTVTVVSFSMCYLLIKAIYEQARDNIKERKAKQ